MNAIIQQFQNELTREERALFEARASRSGHRPGEHLKVLLFGPRGGLAQPDRPKRARRRVGG